MKRYRLVYRGSRDAYYCFDTQTNKRESRGINNADEAQRLVDARNEAVRHVGMNLPIAQVYLQHSDPTLATRTPNQAHPLVGWPAMLEALAHVLGNVHGQRLRITDNRQQMAFRLALFLGGNRVNAVVSLLMNKGRGGRRWRAAPPRPRVHPNRVVGFGKRFEVIYPRGSTSILRNSRS